MLEVEDVIERVVEKIISYELIIHPGETLADILKERGILYAELAAELGVSISYISDVMAGKENISKGLALGLEQVLGVHLLQTAEFRHSLLPELPALMWHQFIAAMM